MNLAYLILTHHQPAQLLRLVDRLDQPNAHFFIHVDEKSNDRDAIEKSLAGRENVRIISKYPVNWMGFNMIKSTLSLIQLAYSSGINFKYYILMSGQDYPVKSNKYISDFFKSNDADFISYNKISYMPESFRDKVRYYHFPDFEYSNPRSAKKIPLLVKLYYGGYKRLKKLMPQRTFYNNYEACFGSQWFALTNETIRYILKFIGQNKGFLKFMRFTEGADEIFFQTIIFNSERKTNLYDYYRFADWLKTRKDGEIFVAGYSSLRYMDWSERGKSKPAVLDSSYYQILRDGNDLFARKFDPVVSGELLDKIDANLLGSLAIDG